MKSRRELKDTARQLFWEHWITLVLSAAVLWIASQILTQIQSMMRMPQETVDFYQSMPGLETFASQLNVGPDQGLPFLTVFALLLVASFFTALLGYGMSNLALRAVKEQEVPELGIFYAYRRFGRWTLFYVIYLIRVMLWTMLFFVPGIMAALSYSQAKFLMMEDEDLRPNDAIKKSTQLMQGRRWELFIIHLSFFGYYVLSVFTFGLSTLFSTPYMDMTFAGWYRELIAQQPAQSSPSPSQAQQHS